MKVHFLSRILFCLCMVSMGCATQKSADSKYLWLEDIEGAKALSWVKEHNDKSIAKIKSDSKVSELESELKEIILAKDRIPMPTLQGNKILNFWQDEVHVKGLWRQTSLESYRQAEPKWETILDIDELAKKDQKEWVFKGAHCLKPSYNPCLIYLSNGGKDAFEVREFDVEKKSFIENGFYLPEAKHRIAWLDKDHLVIGSDFGKGSMTSSGYPRILKLWTRGKDLSSASTVFEGAESDVQVYPVSYFQDGKNLVQISRYITYYNSEKYFLTENLKLVQVPIPNDATIEGYHHGEIFYKIRSDLKTSQDKGFTEGSVLSLKYQKPESFSESSLVLKPDIGESIESFVITLNDVYAVTLKNVQSEMFKLDFKSGVWTRKKLNLPTAGSIQVQSENEFQDEFLISFENFLTPTSIMISSKNKNKLKFQTIKALPKKFDSEKMAVEQYFAVSKDGTKIPYFVVHQKDMTLNGLNPTVLYGYGGFEISQTPFYASTWGKSWISRRGVFVLANLRGGGEFGPKWHLDGIKEKKQNVFDDFIAIAEDLIAKKITSPEKLAIMGGSNGGLLVGATMVQRPELFKAVVCQVPLLDMMRYHKLLAGFSWVNEYGNPEDPKMKEVILKYSPLQNVKKDTKYPEILFVTSTKDDRVHPGHARKMAAKMEDFGNKVYYYENTGGGHGADANLNERVFRKYLEFSFLFEKL